MIMPREMGHFNLIGFWTLYQREVRRFVKVYTQTVLAPVITTLMFFAVFALALGGQGREVAGVDFMLFLAPGLIMMSMVQNAFANTSSSVVIAKVQGNIVDLLMPPISAGEMGLALVLGGVTRGVIVGMGTALAIVLFVDLPMPHWGYAAFFAVSASTMLSLIGVMGGIWSEKFDHIAAVTNFIITPASFLSGTFYSIDRLPEVWQTVVHFNPFFYMIDGFRFSLIGVSDTDPTLGMAVLTAANLALAFGVWLMLKKGYKLKP